MTSYKPKYAGNFKLIRLPGRYKPQRLAVQEVRHSLLSRALCMMLSLLLAVSLLPLTTLTALAADTLITGNGYTFDTESGKLTVSTNAGTTAWRGDTNISTGSDRSVVKSLEITSAVTEIGANAFNGCTGLTSAVIPNSVTTFGNAIFFGCASLTSVTIPSSVTSAGINVFYNCYSLVSVTVPRGTVTVAPNPAAAGTPYLLCSGLTANPLNLHTFTIVAKAKSGETFLSWGGASSGITSVTSASTTYDMPVGAGTVNLVANFALPVTNSGSSASVTYSGSTIDLSSVSNLFTIDSNAGTATYTIESTGNPTGEGSIGADGKTLTATKAGTFTIGLVTAVTGTHAAGAKVTATLTVNKGSQSTPNAPTSSGKTDTTVTLTANSAMEFKCDAGSWQTSNEFTGLSTNTQYSFSQRLAATDLYNASEDSSVLRVTTDKTKLAAPSNVAVSNTGEVSWNAVTSAGSYTIKVYTSSGTLAATVTGKTGTSYKLANGDGIAAAGTGYYVKVTAIAGLNYSNSDESAQSTGSFNVYSVALTTSGITGPDTAALGGSNVTTNTTTTVYAIHGSKVAFTAVAGPSREVSITGDVTTSGTIQSVTANKAFTATFSDSALPSLGKVTGAALSTTGQATWTNLTSEMGLANYSIQLYKNGTALGSPKTSMAASGATGVSFLSEMRTEGVGSYTVVVTAIGNGTTHTNGTASDASSAQAVAKLPTPTNLAWSGDNATFNKLSDETNVDKYSIAITGTGTVASTDVAKTGSNLSVAVTSPASGDTFKVKAIAATTGLYLDSDESSASSAYASAGLTDAQKAAADKDALTFNTIKNSNTAENNITGSLTLPDTGSIHGSDITWSAAPTGYINTTTGAVTRPSYGNADVTVTLTATITNGTATETKTFTLIIKAQSSGGGGGGGGGGGTPSPKPGPAPSPTPSPTPAPDDPSVFVDGKKTEAGIVTTTDNTTKVTVDQDTLNKEIETAKDNVTVVVPAETGTAVAQLVVQNVDDMAAKEMSLTVQVGNVAYEIPTTAVDTASVLASLGAENPIDVPISITITTDMSASAQAAVQTAITNSGSAELVIPPMEFKMTATYQGKTVEIDTFSQYVSRSVEITAAQAAKITTAVVVEPDGTTRQVPTRVYQSGGKWYAEVNSLTNSTYALVYNEKIFTDAKGKWYENAVNEMGSRMVISGIGNNLFAGERDITRAEFAAIIVRALGLPSNGNGAVFSDVANTVWYFGAVGTAYEYGIVSGVGNGLFAPDKKITRQEAMLMIQRAAKITGFKGQTGNMSAFIDAGSVSAWAYDAALWNVGSGLVAGSNGQLRPLDNITRAETATLVLKLLQRAGLVDERTPLNAQAAQEVAFIAEPRKEPELVQMPDDSNEENF